MIKIIRLNTFVLLIFCWNVISACKREKEGVNFDPQGWKCKDENLRGAMVNDLIQRKILLGLSKNESLQILGIPDDSSKHKFIYKINPLSNQKNSNLLQWNSDFCVEFSEGKIIRVWIND